MTAQRVEAPDFRSPPRREAEIRFSWREGREKANHDDFRRRLQLALLEARRESLLNDGLRRGFSIQADREEELKRRQLLAFGRGGAYHQDAFGRAKEWWTPRNLFKLWHLAFAQAKVEQIQTIPYCPPDIDSLGKAWVRSGGFVDIYGSCFGEHRGMVWLKLEKDAGPIALPVFEWEPNFIRVQVPLQSGRVPYHGWIQVERDDGGEVLSSQQYPTMFLPTYDYFWAYFSQVVHGGAFGNSYDSVAHRDVFLDSPAFVISEPHLKDDGDGWAKLQAPNMSGRQVAQGFHVGVAWHQSHHVELIFNFVSPVGIQPPFRNGSVAYAEYPVGLPYAITPETVVL